MRPTHSGRRFIANRAFTDRETPRAIFDKALQVPQGSEDYRGLSQWLCTEQAEPAALPDWAFSRQGIYFQAARWCSLDALLQRAAEAAAASDEALTICRASLSAEHPLLGRILGRRAAIHAAMRQGQQAREDF